MSLCVNYWAYERILHGHKEQGLSCSMTAGFLCHFEQNGVSMSLIKTADRNPILIFHRWQLRLNLLKNYPL